MLPGSNQHGYDFSHDNEDVLQQWIVLLLRSNYTTLDQRLLVNLG